MRTFTSVVNNNWPKRAIRVTAGDMQIYMGINSAGLKEMKPEVIAWLDTHKILHCNSDRYEIELVYRKNAKLKKMVFGNY